MATAIAVAPGGEVANVQTVTEQLALIGTAPLDLSSEAFFREERIVRGDTVSSLLSRLGIRDSEAVRFIHESPAANPLHRQLAPGKVVSASTNETGDLISLHFPLNGKDATLTIVRTANGFKAGEQVSRPEIHRVMKTAEIRYSLFGATDAAGIPDAIATQMADIFGGEIDFHRDLRKGDRFSIVYEMNYLQGQPARAGRILSAEFTNNGKTFSAVYYENEGRGGYYTPDGKSLRKAFLRSPLEFSRVTSGFAMRFHPILQQWRAHKGVDYGAPIGTRVRSTGDGTIEFAGQQGGYGNLVIIRHAGSYSTAYGHLKGFGPGIRKGTRISQGDTVGYVGQTGWATGPHLHYEFRINNQQVNPLAAVLPSTPPLEASQLARFRTQTAALAGQLELLRSTNLAALD